MATVLVTGASGFVGTALAVALKSAGHRVRRALRTADATTDADSVVVGDLDRTTDWARALDGVDAVAHLAARTHVMRETAVDALAEYRRVNVDGTAALARAAIAAGVRRFVLLSSIKVNGEATQAQPFTEADAPSPLDAYGRSKWEAEQALRAAAGAALETVVLRSPLIYGPGVKGNLRSLLGVVRRGWPLPLGGIVNRRSLLGLDNLTSALVLALTHPAARDRCFLLADGEDVSTPQLVRMIAAGLDRRARLVPVSAHLLRTAGALLGRGDAIARLTGSLQIDASAFRTALGWQPAVPIAEGLARMARWYDRRALPASSS